MNKKDNIKYSNLPIISKGKIYKQNTSIYRFITT